MGNSVLVRGFAVIGVCALLTLGFQNCAQPNTIGGLDAASGDTSGCWAVASGGLIETCNSNIGVGTSTPKAKLQVAGGTTVLQQEPWTAGTLQNGYTNYGGSYAPAAFFKDSSGVVHLRGLVTGGASSTACVFTLPVGYRPAYRAIFATMQDNANVGEYSGRLDVTSAGCITTPDASIAYGYLSLEGVTFLAEQ